MTRKRCCASAGWTSPPAVSRPLCKPLQKRKSEPGNWPSCMTRRGATPAQTLPARVCLALVPLRAPKPLETFLAPPLGHRNTRGQARGQQPLDTHVRPRAPLPVLGRRVVDARSPLLHLPQPPIDYGPLLLVLPLATRPPRNLCIPPSRARPKRSRFRALPLDRPRC